MAKDPTDPRHLCIQTWSILKRVIIEPHLRKAMIKTSKNNLVELNVTAGPCTILRKDCLQSGARKHHQILSWNF